MRPWTSRSGFGARYKFRDWCCHSFLSFGFSSVFKSCVRDYKPASVRRTGIGRGDPRCCFPSPSNLHCSLTFSGFSHNFNQIPTGEEWKKFIQKPLHTKCFFFQEMKGSVFIFFSFFFPSAFFSYSVAMWSPHRYFLASKRTRTINKWNAGELSFIFTKDVYFCHVYSPKTRRMCNNVC